MSPSRRRKTSERTSKPSRRQLADDLSELEPATGDELPLLEPAEELEELEPESPIKIEVGAAEDLGFETEVVLDVPEMDKKAVADALAAPLRWAADKNAAALRYRTVLVRFAGETLISTAAKDAVAEVMRGTKAVKVVVRRGYGDELVHEGALPKVAVKTRVAGDAVHVDIDSGTLDSNDLAAALQRELPKLTQAAKGKTYALTFHGSGPEAEVRSLLRAELLAAGATRARVDDAILFDRELESRVTFASSAGSAAIGVTPADDEDTTIAALDLVLMRNAAQLGGRKVFVEFHGRRAQERELARLVEISRSAQPARVQIAAASGEPDQIWPPLLELAEVGDLVVLHVRDGGRGRGGLVASFQREARALAAHLHGKSVTVDWPAGFDLDDALVKACVVDAVGAAGPRAVACTLAGEDREPFLPPPVTVAPGGSGGWVARLDTDAGKPQELVRAIERRLQASAAELRGQALRFEVKGSATTSRGMLRALSAASDRAGVARLEVEDRGVVDVVSPPLVAVTRSGAGAVRLAADPAGRNEAQVELALQRELEGVPAGDKVSWTVAASPLADALVAAAVARGVGCVVLEGDPPVQVHPPLLTVEADADGVTLRASPPSDDGAAAAQLAHELPAILQAQGDLGARTVRIVWPGAKLPATGVFAELVRRLVAAAPSRIMFDDGRGRRKQLHPEVVPDYVTLLGRKDDPAAPLVMLGIDAGRGDEHTARVLAKLATHAALLDGRRVLLVLRADDRDVAVNDKDPLVAAVRAVVDPVAAATLAYRGVDAQRRPFFVVVHSRIDKVAVGTRFSDPRVRRAK